VDTSKESSFATPVPVDGYAAFDSRLTQTPEPSMSGLNPDDPPWGVSSAMLVWMGSVMLLLVVPALIIIPYAMYGYRGAGHEDAGQSILNDPNTVLLAVLSIIPVHILTLGMVWMVVTGFGKRPFWQTLGWSWSSTVGPWTSIFFAVMVLVVGGLLSWMVGGEPTEIDQIIASSTATRISVAILATLTAPLVEEMIYRGLIYSALQRVTGVVWAVIIVSSMFASVHVWQYRTNLGVIAAISIFSLSLTFMRAYSGRLLPCYVMHLVFNGIQSVLIISQPYIEPSGGEQKAALFDAARRLIQNLG
jgi:membrane protease YdiL (CAAX protease family)